VYREREYHGKTVAVEERAGGTNGKLEEGNDIVGKKMGAVYG
jgi:hypothetical protein